MLRAIQTNDAQAITDIYNYYVTNSAATFETVPISTEDMRQRIADISPRFPYFVFEQDGLIAGYCYAHPWKERAAYRHTLETTVYVAPQYAHRGIGLLLMQNLIAQCRQAGYHALIACITQGNEASIKLHERLGFCKASHFKQVGFKFGHFLDVVDFELLLTSPTVGLTTSPNIPL